METSTLQDPFMFSMPLQEGHEKSLAIETRQAKVEKENSEARRSHIHRPTGEPSTRVDRTNGGFLNETAL